MTKTPDERWPCSVFQKDETHLTCTLRTANTGSTSGSGRRRPKRIIYSFQACLRSAKVRAHKPSCARLNCYNSKSTDLSAPIKLARMFSDLSYRLGTWARG